MPPMENSSVLDSRGTNEVHCFLCETTGEPKLREPEKSGEWRWFSPDATPENFINPPALGLPRGAGAS